MCGVFGDSRLAKFRPEGALLCVKDAIIGGASMFYSAQSQLPVGCVIGHQDCRIREHQQVFLRSQSVGADNIVFILNPGCRGLCRILEVNMKGRGKQWDADEALSG